MPHPGEVSATSSAASTPRRSILETFGHESDDEIMDVDDEVEEEVDELEEEVTAVDADAEAERFLSLPTSLPPPTRTRRSSSSP